VFAPAQAAAPAGQQIATVKIAARTRAYSDYWRGASIDRARLADALSPLPDSAEELKAVQRWSRFAGQFGGLAKVDSGFDYAANLSSFACVA
jgi:hypothetical protein